MKVKVYTAEWSKPSRDLVQLIKDFGQQFLPDAEFEFSPLEEVSHQKDAIRIYPTITKSADGVETHRHAGQLDLLGLVEFVNKE